MSESPQLIEHPDGSFDLYQDEPDITSLDPIVLPPGLAPQEIWF